MEQAAVVKALSALAQPIRLKVFRALVAAGADGLTPSVMAEQIDLAPSSLSFHLKELMNAGLITQERASRNLVYRPAFDCIDALLQYLTESCCQGEACSVADVPLSCC